MIFADYVRLIRDNFSTTASEENKLTKEREFAAAPLSRGISTDKLDKLLTTKVAARREAPPQPGTFPLIVLGHGIGYESPINHFILCEYLASHGYVIATAPLLGTNLPLVNLDLIDLETQVRDMEFVISRARAFPNASRERLGLIGFDLGGMASLILQMRNTDVDALIALDSGIMFEHNTRLLRQSPFYDPEKLRVPLMAVTGMTAEIEATGVHEDLSLFEAAKYATTRLIRIGGMRHSDFTSITMIEEVIPGFSGLTRDHPGRNYETLCTYSLNFLDAYLRNDPKSLAFLQEEIAPKNRTVSVEIRSGRPSPPSEGQFIQTLLEDGFDQAARMYKKVKAEHPDLTLFRESVMNRLGYRFLYQLGNAPAAIQIFKLNVEAFPRSPNLYDSLAEAYLVSGDREAAIANYMKSLELNPANANAVEKLKALRAR